MRLALNTHRIAQIREAMLLNNYYVVDNWLEEATAQNIADRIEAIKDWSPRICDTNGPRIVEARVLEELGISALEFARNLSDSTSALARGGTMAYLFFVKALSEFDPALFNWWSNGFLGLANEMTGQDNTFVEEPQVTLYSAGCFLGQHSDGVGSRQIAFIANFTRSWQPDFGGCLTICQNGRWEVLIPKFNSLILLNVRAQNCHFVSQVATWVDRKRIAITGWVGR